MTKDSTKTTKIFLNPSGFIEQHFYGEQSPEAIIQALKQLKTYSQKIESQSKPVLILEDVSELKRLEFLSPKMAKVRQEAAETMKEINFKKAAVYGSLHIQVIVTTLALVAGKRSKLQVFDNRAAAIRWLLNKK